MSCGIGEESFLSIRCIIISCGAGHHTHLGQPVAAHRANGRRTGPQIQDHGCLGPAGYGGAIAGAGAVATGQWLRADDWPPAHTGADLVASAGLIGRGVRGEEGRGVVGAPPRARYRRPNGGGDRSDSGISVTLWDRPKSYTPVNFCSVPN